MFVNRQEELSYFNQILTRTSPGPAQLLVLYGRRRVGKSALLRHWTAYSGLPATYWVAANEPPALQRRSLYAAVAKVPFSAAPAMESWADFWEWLAGYLAQDYSRRIIILDDFPIMAAADNQMLPALQNAWDSQLRYGNAILLLCGSHMKTMESLFDEDSPLAGRLTGDWLLQPLPFQTLRQFFPGMDLEDRIALYQMVGGVPAYLSWLNPELSLLENISQVMLDPSRVFLVEPQLLLYDELRELGNYTAVIEAIANGHHTLSTISRESRISPTSLMFYLSRLQELQLVERRLPVTLDEHERQRSKRGRYYLLDPFFEFYYRFLAAHVKFQRSVEETTALVEEQLPELGRSAFITLAREWIARQAESGRATSALPFMPEAIGAYWSSRVTVDVAAVNWRTQDILLAECDWGLQPTSGELVANLAEKKARLLRQELPNEGQFWTFHYGIFTRTGLTETAQAELLPRGGLNVHLTRLERGLGL